MSDKTLCMIGVNGDKTHYDYHSLYGLTEAAATRRALDQVYARKRSPLISRCVAYSVRSSFVCEHLQIDVYYTWTLWWSLDR